MNTPTASDGRLRELDGAVFVKFWKSGATAVDLRDAVPFGQSHLAGSVHIKANSPDFVGRIARFTPEALPIIFVADSRQDAEWADAELMGHRIVGGYVIGPGVLDQADSKIALLPALAPADLFAKLDDGENLTILDVREPAEWREGAIAGALLISMNEVLGEVEQLPKGTPIAITCAGGQRSSLIGSLLLTRGYTKLFNVTGGMKAWTAAKLPIS